jgi:phosphatidylinositol alpha-mannosyltransferase
MKIGIVTEYYYPTLGGIQEHVYHFALEAMARGHEVRIVTPVVANVPDGQVNGVRPMPLIHVGISVPIYQNGSIARVAIGRRMGARLEQVFEHEAFDVVHVHSPLTPTLPLLALTRSPTYTFGTFHTNFNGNFLLKIFRQKLQTYLDRLDGLIAVSPSAARPMQAYFQTPCRIIPNGIDVVQFSPDVPRRKELNDGRFNVLWVGRMEPRNGLDRMIAAFAQASETRNDLRLVVVGDGPLRPTYEAMVPTHLKPWVHFEGFINSGRPSYYASADLLCVPASISSFGITLLEGMAAGKPVIASDIDGFRDVMTHDKEGLLLDTTDPDAFGGAIARLAADRELAAAYGKRGRETALGYAWGDVTERVLAFYREVMSRAEGAEACPPA